MPVGSCFAAQIRDGRYTVCQVIATEADDQVEIVALDWLGDRPPNLSELDGARVLVVDHHNWDADPQRRVVPGVPPPEFIALGVREPLAQFDEPCRSYGFWEGTSHQISIQRWWHEQVPTHEVEAYKQAKAHAAEKLTIELGGRRFEAPRGTSRVRIGPDASFVVEPDASVDWSALDVFGRLDTIEYEGTDVGVLEYVTRRVLIGELAWRGHGQSRIDLSNAHLRRLTVEVPDSPLEVVLSPEVEVLQLQGYRGQPLTVVHPGHGRSLEVALFDLGETPPSPVAGLEQLSALRLVKPRRVDLASLGYPTLESLSIHFDVGQLDHLDALRRYPSLRELRLFDVYEMAPEQLPSAAELPQLGSVEVRGLRKSHVATIKARLAGIAQLELGGAKTDAWLAANAHNPFNNWVDEGAGFGRAACKACKQSLGRVAKLEADDVDGLHAEMNAFIQAFNRIDGNHGLDTIHREHVYDVFHQIVQDSPVEVARETIDRWFDEDREF